MALVAPVNGELNEVPQSQLSSMEPPRFDGAYEMASEYSSSVSGAALVASGDSTEQFSRSPSRQKELDLVSAAALKSEEYRQLFRLPPGEVLVQDFNCALQESMLYQKILPFSEITLLRRAKTAGIFSNAIEISTGERKEDTEAPKVSEDFVKVAEAQFPINVDDFFRFFFSDTTFVESFRKSCGDTDFKCTDWCPSEKSGLVRELSFQHPIKFYLGAKSGSCKERQKIQAYRNSHLIVETSQEVNGVPFADYFSVEGLWDVENDESGEACVMKVYRNVAFSKKTMWKGIVRSTMEECREAYAIWINIAHELLKKKNLERKDEAPTRSVNEDIIDHSDQEAKSRLPPSPNSSHSSCCPSDAVDNSAVIVKTTSSSTSVSDGSLQ
ncbi:unnamed protein product [Rhodiola kirilowii]